jgi:glycosyltransferase involved in cell wall biosynthesis
MNPIYYIYPRFSQVSFSKISREHIKHLSKKIKIYEIDEEILDGLMWIDQRTILLHPILYSTIGDNPNMFKQRQERLKRLLKVKGKLGGFETSDSDKISEIAVETLNQFDLIFLPSNWAKEVFQKCGVKSPIEVIPHGLNETFISNDKSITDETVKRIQRIKERDGAILVLFFMMHSNYRKGADLVYEAMKDIQLVYPNIYLVIKHSSNKQQIEDKFKKLKLIEVSGWMEENQLRQLYDVCDMLLCPSRGGGFELNALEGIARGLPTLVPEAGCFMDYIEYAIPLTVRNHPKVFPDNPIHIGNGWETSAEDLFQTIEKVYFNLSYYKEKAKEYSQHVKEKYNWQIICEKLYKVLKEYNFCD